MRAGNRRLHGCLSPVRGPERVDQPVGRPCDEDGIAGLLGHLHAAFGRQPFKVVLTELANRRGRYLVGLREEHSRAVLVVFAELPAGVLGIDQEARQQRPERGVVGRLEG